MAIYAIINIIVMADITSIILCLHVRRYHDFRPFPLDVVAITKWALFFLAYPDDKLIEAVLTDKAFHRLYLKK